MIPIVLGVAILVFTLMTFCPGDPAATILGSTATEVELAAKREELGLNDPFIVRLADYLSDVFIHFDLGKILDHQCRHYGVYYRTLTAYSDTDAGNNADLFWSWHSAWRFCGDASEPLAGQPFHGDRSGRRIYSEFLAGAAFDHFVFC